MAGFLRRKKQDTAPPPSPIRTPSPVNAQPSPIFARFATSVQPDAQRVVSSPMALTSAPRRDQAPGISNGGAARGQREDVKQRRQAAGPSYVQTSTQDYSAASASNDYVPSYGPSSKNRLSTPPSQTQTLPPATQPTNNRPTGAGPAYVRSNPQYPSNSTAASASNAYTPSQSRNRMSTPPSRTQTLPPTAPPSNPPNRRFSQLPGTDKPLPSIIPQDNPSDPLGSRPPQSSLPANRRASTRGASGATQNPPNGRAAQQPHISSPTRSPSNATPGVGTRTFVSPSQTPSAAPNSALGSSQDPSRYQKEHARQDLRHKLSDASTASGLQPVIAAPASPPRHNGQWAPDGRAAIAAPAPTPSSYEDPVASFTPPNPNSRAAVISPPPTPPSPSPSPPPQPQEPEPETDMGATISSFEVQSFHPDNSFKINTGLLPAQHIAPAAKPKRAPSSLVKGKPLIFSAMDSSPSEKAEYDPYRSVYPTPPPPTEVVKMPPRLLTEESDSDGHSDLGFSRAVLESWEQQQQPSSERQTPKVNGNTSLPNVVRAAHPQTPRLNGNSNGSALQSPPPPLVIPFQQPQTPQTPQRVATKNRNPIASPTPSSPATRSTPLSPATRSTPLSPATRLAPLSPTTRPTLTPNDPHTPHTPRTLTKPRPTTPQRKISSTALQQPSPLIVGRDIDERAVSRASTLMLDDDPFAKVEGVRMLPPAPPPPPSSTDPASSPTRTEGSVPDSPSTPRQEGGFDAAQSQNAVHSTPPQKAHGQGGSKAPPSPVTPEDYRTARSRRRGDQLEKAPPSGVKGVEVRETRIPGPFPFAECVAHPQLLFALLGYLSFYDWLVLSAVTKEIRMHLVGTPELREAALERYLRTVGYSRWAWEDTDPLELSLLDLHDYMRGVSTPTHEYSRVAEKYVQSFNLPPQERDPALHAAARNLTMSTRAYTRVVLRLRAQAEREASDAAALKSASPPPAARKRITSSGYASSRSSPSRASAASSRAPSPNSGHSHPHPSTSGTAFRSPLFRLKRAPLLRVFVPSPDGDWLSDKSVLECEAELKRAGVIGLLRIGDVVWDVAVGDEGNVGRLVWDGSYLIDLDYKYSSVGDLPQYLPTLAFPPSYFHRVIRTGPASTNPVIHVDISPWGQEIAANLQLLQDRVRTETPQGNVHNVVRWVHRSSFVVRAPAKPRMSSSSRRPQSPRIPIPETAGLFVDPGWYGTIVVETEGTNEALADLQDRCPGAFPPRAGGPPTVLLKEAKDAKKVFKILREKSRPGEIWMRAVGPKERLF